MNPRLRERAMQALARLPTTDGGAVVIMATASQPPAMAVLSTADILLTDERVRVGVFAGSSVTMRLGGAFSLMVPADALCLRVEVVEATTEVHGDLALVEGRLHDVRPTAEPPWVVDMVFRPGPQASEELNTHVDYWATVREWLAGGRLTPPQVPM